MNDRAVFFDRDDTLMEDVPYCRDPQQVRLLPGAPQALLSLQQCGFLLFIVSNQSGVGRRLISAEQVQAVNEELLRQLGPGLITKIYTCFSAPGEDTEECRKPKPGMIFQARDEFHLDLDCCFLVGDKPADIECARNAGCKCVLLLTGTHGESLTAAREMADFIAADLATAADWICRQ